MVMQRFDILYLSDLRLSGGVATALVEQAKANAKAGYANGLVNVWSTAGKPSRFLDKRVRRLLETGILHLADAERPIEAALVIAIHPALFVHLPAKPIRISGYQKLLLVTQPPYDGHGQPNYDAGQLDGNAQEMLGGDVAWTPVNPMARLSIERTLSAPIWPTVWAGVLDADEWTVTRDGYVGDQVVVGRHTRPDRLKWPDTAEETLQAYPARRDLVVRILGDSGSLLSLLGSYPLNWRVLPSGTTAPSDFVKTIDHFVYFHHSRHVDSYGYAILEAMTAGAVPILPRSFEAQFDGAALYAEPNTVLPTVERLRDHPARFREASAAAVAFAREHFGTTAHTKRVRETIGPPRGGFVALKRPMRRALFLSSNGIGLGHLTRQLAIARRCGDGVEPVFVTMSQAISVVSDFGFFCEYIPHHRHLPLCAGDWNRMLAKELADKVAFYGVDVIVFDGNVIYPGLAEVLAGSPTCWRVWVRRAMWRAGAGAKSIEHEALFDVVIEPGEIPAAFDAGLTRSRRSRTRRVDPIRLLDNCEQMSRARARHALSIPDDRVAVLVQLGARNNSDTRDVEDEVLAFLARASGLYVAYVKWPIADGRAKLPPSVKVLNGYPVVRYLAAFDATVSAAGYNSFHDIIANRLPAAFLPNENPMMDDQLARAHHAAAHGYGVVLRERDPYGVASTLDRLLDPAEQRRMRGAAARFRIKNGAAAAAQLVEELLATVRTDRDHRAVILPAMRGVAL